MLCNEVGAKVLLTGGTITAIDTLEGFELQMTVKVPHDVLLPCHAGPASW